MVNVFIEPKKHVLGRNVFSFAITDKGILPGGADYYAPNISHLFNANCVTPNGKLAGGQGCTFWVIKNGNMDYLECPEKIAQGAKSCK